MLEAALRTGALASDSKDLCPAALPARAALASTAHVQVKPYTLDFLFSIKS